MTDPAPVDAASQAGPPRSRTGLVLGILVAGVIVLALFLPQPNTYGDRLTTHSTGPMGAQLVYDLADRLGWSVQRRIAMLESTPSVHVVNVLLEPEGGPDAMEVHHLLDGVRAGGGLLLAGVVGAMQDSVGYLFDDLGTPRVAEGATATNCPPDDRLSAIMLIPVLTPPVKWGRPTQSVPVVFATVPNTDGGEREAAFSGVSYGAGRVAIAGSGALFRNDVVRRCRYATDVALVRALEWLGGAAGTPRILVFDEYHHGFGAHPGSIATMSRYATETQSGHVLLQAAIAGLLLLIAAAPRVIAPRPDDRVMRRSPLEQADALAHAYETVGATRTVTSRLVSGVRRRAGFARGSASADDAAFLDTVAAAWPAVVADTEIVRRALTQSIPARELTRVGQALERIEATLTLPRPSRGTR